MSTSDREIAELLDRAQQGEGDAQDRLLAHHRSRLRHMVALRMDPQLKARVDPSDVVQDTLLEASRKLPEYLRNRPLPFYPWLRQIAWERLVHLRVRHVVAQKRSVTREVGMEMLSDQSVLQLAEQLVDTGTSPSGRAIRREMQERVRSALNELAPRDGDVLVMWYLERLSIGEIAAILQLTESGVKSRHRRALLRLTEMLSGKAKED